MSDLITEQTSQNNTEIGHDQSETKDLEQLVGLDQSRKYNQEHFLTGRIFDGFKDVEVNIGFDNVGKAIDPSREVVVVDREHDENLQEMIQRSKVIQVQSSSQIDTAFKLAQLVYAEMNSPQVDTIIESQLRGDDASYRGQEILLGKLTTKNGLGGVCNHRALLFQVLANEAGLDVTMRRGALIESRNLRGYHVWNEVVIDGKQYIVDTMNPPQGRDFDKLTIDSFTESGAFPETGEKSSKQYLDIEGRTIYKNEPVSTPTSPATEPSEVKKNKDNDEIPTEAEMLKFFKKGKIERFQEIERKGEDGISYILLVDKDGKTALKVAKTQEAVALDEKNQILFQDPNYESETDENGNKKLPYGRKFYTTKDALYLAEIDQQTNRMVRLSKKIGVYEEAGLIQDIPRGLNVDRFKKHIQDAIAFLEKNREPITSDLISSWANNISGYEGIDLENKTKIQTELLARLTLAAADYWLTIKGSYENFANFYINMNKDIFNSLRDEVLGIPGMEIVKKMEETSGEYWRKPKEGLGGRDDADTGFEASLVAAGMSALEAKNKLEIIKRLFHTTGMSSFYTGPIKEIIPTGGPIPAPGAVHLLAEEWMAQSIIPRPLVRGVDTTPTALANYPHFIYHRNERYWQEAEKVMNGRVGKMTRDGKPDNIQIKFAVDDDPASNMRKLLYFPVELDMVARELGTATKTWSLHRAGEIYAMTLPQLSGFKTLEEFMGVVKDQVVGPGGILVNQDNMNQRNKAKNRTFAFALMIKGAGETSSAIMNFMNEPMQGGETAGDDLNRTLKNMLTVIEKISYLGGRSPNILSFATKRILTSTFEWANGSSRDRWQNFPDVPRFGILTKNKVVKVFAANMFEEDLKDALKEVGATNARVRRKESGTALFGFLGDMFGIFSKIFK